MCLHCVGKLIPRTLWSCHGDDNIFIFENINTNSSYSLCCEVVTQTIRDDSMSASASVGEQIYERSCTFAIAMKDQRRRKCGGKGVVEKKLLTMFFFHVAIDPLKAFEMRHGCCCWSLFTCVPITKCDRLTLTHVWSLDAFVPRVERRVCVSGLMAIKNNSWTTTSRQNQIEWNPLITSAGKKERWQRLPRFLWTFSESCVCCHALNRKICWFDVWLAHSKLAIDPQSTNDWYRKFELSGW